MIIDKNQRIKNKISHTKNWKILTAKNKCYNTIRTRLNLKKEKKRKKKERTDTGALGNSPLW